MGLNVSVVRKRGKNHSFLALLKCNNSRCAGKKNEKIFSLAQQSVQWYCLWCHCGVMRVPGLLRQRRHMFYLNKTSRANTDFWSGVGLHCYSRWVMVSQLQGEGHSFPLITREAGILSAGSRTSTGRPTPHSGGARIHLCGIILCPWRLTSPPQHLYYFNLCATGTFKGFYFVSLIQ